MNLLSKIVLVLSLLGLGSGCSSFHREWREAAKVSPTGDRPWEGRWLGTWQSDANGHHGGLKCVLTPGGEPGQYRASFRASYAKVIHFGYVAALTGSESNGVVRFSGSSDLGSVAGGVYRYDGHANATQFLSTYKSGGDHGTFTLKRPK